MGTRPHSNYEDPEFQHLLQSAVDRPPLDTERLSQLIQNRNAQYRNWGFKAPAALQSISYLIHNTRNPHLIFVFRDVLATAIRERTAADADLWESFESVIAYQSSVLKVIRDTDVPCLLVSYGKALLHPAFFCQHLGSFAGITGSSDWIEMAVQQINPGQREYLETIDSGRIFIGLPPLGE